MKKVAVIILNYRVADLTIRCLKSVIKSDYKDLEIIVVDNASDDGLEEEINKFSDIEFIQTGKNLGYTGGNNIGIKKGLELGAEYIFILNPDAYVQKDTIGLLVEGIEKYDAGIVNPKILFDDSDIIWFAGKIFDKANVLASHIGVNQKDTGQLDKDCEIDDVTGAAMLVKSEVFKKVGLFDERYFLYYEESDLAYRARQAGYKLMYIYEAKVLHKNAQSTGLGSGLQDYYITRNRMLFAKKFLSWRARFALFREAIRNFGSPVRRKALIDFMLNKFGKGEY